jgi:hypothetical protein
MSEHPSHALVLFNESAKMHKRTDEIYTPMNIVDFKMQWKVVWEG